MVAIEKRVSASYSNFHTGEHLRQFADGSAASEASTPETLGKYFHNCFYMAYDCAENLRSHFRKSEDLAKYESHVVLATDNWEQRATSARQYHCIVMLPLPEPCIIIDPVAHHYAIKVAVNTTWETAFSAFRYCYAGIDDVCFLVDVSPDPDTNLHYSATANTPTHNHPYRALRDGREDGIRGLVYPSDNYRGRTLSTRRMFIYGLWDRQPSSGLDFAQIWCHIPTVPGRSVGRYVVETCRIAFSFENQSISVTTIPLEWLKDASNANIRKGLEHSSYYYTYGTLGGFRVDLKTGVNIQQGYLKRTLDNLEFMQELLEALGMRKGELMRMAKVMMEYWQEEDRNKPKKVLKRKR